MSLYEGSKLAATVAARPGVAIYQRSHGQTDGWTVVDVTRFAGSCLLDCACFYGHLGANLKTPRFILAMMGDLVFLVLIIIRLHQTGR